MAAKNLTVVLETFEEESLLEFQSGCVGSMYSEELSPVLLRLKHSMVDKRQSALDRNSGLLRVQAEDLKVSCVAEAKVCHGLPICRVL